METGGRAIVESSHESDHMSFRITILICVCQCYV